MIEAIFQKPGELFWT